MHGVLIKLKKIKLIKFCQILEQKIQEEINDAYPTNWDEDYITRRILVAVKSMSNSQVEHLTIFNNIFIAAFKQNGKNENKLGDIAFILDITYKDGERLRGVAFLEAKKKYKGKNKYTAIKLDQLKRIYKYAPSSRLLLYNYKYMSNLAPTGIDSSSSSPSGILPRIPSTYTSVLPMNLVIHLDTKKDSLEKYSIPFSYQFSFRYLFGMELEFGEKLISEILGNADNKEDLPQYIVTITSVPGKKNEKEVNPISNLDVNREKYSEITDIARFDEK